MASPSLDWEKIRKDASTISFEQAVHILRSANDRLKSEGKRGDILDIDTLLKVRDLKAAALRGEVDKFDTSVGPEKPPDGRYPVVDIFHPVKPGCIVAYEDEEGNTIEETENAERSEVIRVRRARAEAEKKKLICEGDLEKSGEHGRSAGDGGCSSADVCGSPDVAEPAP